MLWKTKSELPRTEQMRELALPAQRLPPVLEGTAQSIVWNCWLNNVCGWFCKIKPSWALQGGFGGWYLGRAFSQWEEGIEGRRDGGRKFRWRRWQSDCRGRCISVDKTRGYRGWRQVDRRGGLEFSTLIEGFTGKGACSVMKRARLTLSTLSLKWQKASKSKWWVESWTLQV